MMNNMNLMGGKVMGSVTKGMGKIGGSIVKGSLFGISLAGGTGSKLMKHSGPIGALGSGIANVQGFSSNLIQSNLIFACM